MSGKFRVIDSGRMYERGGTGNGGGGDMLSQRVDALEKRVGVIEDKVDNLTNRVNDAAIQLAKIDGKLTHMPTSLQIIAIVGAIVGLAVAFLRLV